jgi:hypothetical protein
MNQPIEEFDPRIMHAWWASDRPLAYLMVGYREVEATHPAIWIRTFDPSFIADHGHERDEIEGFTDLILGYIRHSDALHTFINFMDALSAQIARVQMPQPNTQEKSNDEKDEASAQSRSVSDGDLQSDQGGIEA